MLYRLVTDSRGLVGQKLGVSAEKPCKIQHFHRDPFRHSLENLGWPSKLYRSMQHFMHYRLVTDSRVVVDQKLGFGPKNHIRYMIFIVILAAIRSRIWVDLLNYTDRCTILCSIDRWQIQGGLWAKNRGLQEKNLLKYLFSRKSLQILVSVCARVLYLLCRRGRLGSSEWYSFLIGCREKLSEVNWMWNFVSRYIDIRIHLMILLRLGHSLLCKVCSNFANMSSWTLPINKGSLHKTIYRCILYGFSAQTPNFWLTPPLESVTNR